MSIKIGIIGCGALGVIHAQRFAAIPGVEVAGLADPDSTGVERAVQTLGYHPRVTSCDYQALLQSDLDAVCIASPDGFHVRQLLDSLVAGLHVLCEKPLTPHPQELEQVVHAQAKSGLHVSLTYPRRYNARIRGMRSEILSGRWGAVTAISAYDCEDWITPNEGTWRHDPDICPGGFLYDANGHQIDTLLWTTGLEPVAVMARTNNRGRAVPIAAWGTAELTGGIPLTFSFVGHARRWREQVNIHCERADFLLENGSALWTRGGKPEPVPTGFEDETADSAFLKLLLGEGPNWAPPHELWPVLQFTGAALESAATGQRRRVRQESEPAKAKL